VVSGDGRYGNAKAI
jgi:phosphoglucomutase